MAGMETATIFALASAPGRSGVAVVRVSGPSAEAAIQALCARPTPAPRKAVLRRLVCPVSGETIDHGLVLWFPAPHSFTGEPVAEFHLHGGRAVVAAALAALAGLPGVRPAEPGEFSRRAFEHGKLDLTAAEGLADLIGAETAAQRRLALSQFEGGLGRLYEAWRTQLIQLGARIEAEIDFSDQDLPGNVLETVGPSLAELRAAIEDHLRDGRRGERLREGVAIAIIGAPNVGKSTLMNALARREVAIVSPRAGTTRDVLEVALDFGGYPVVLADTAGIRPPEDEIEGEGVRRAEARAAAADLRLAVFDAGEWPRVDPVILGLVDGNTIPVINKADLGAERAGLAGPVVVGGQPAVVVSARTGGGLAALVERVGTAVAERTSTGDSPLLTRERHRRALEAAAGHLDRAVTAPALELVAEDVRLAARALGQITGRVDIDDTLDVIFREFCIGK